MLYLNGAVFTYPEKPWLEKKKLVLKFEKKKPDFPSICAAVAASTHKLTPPLTHAHNNMHVWWSMSHLLVCKNNMFRMRRQKRAPPCSVQLRSNMHSNHVQDLFMFMLFLCLPVYLTMASTERRVTAETCCQLYFVVKLLYFVCLFDQIAPTALAQWITNRLVIERLL